MAEKKLYIGSMGPFLYDDTEGFDDPDGDFGAETLMGLRTNGSITCDQAPVAGGDIVRKDDLDGVEVTVLNHHDRHDPEDGADALDCAAAAEISVVVAASEGSAHSFARSDHVHAISHGIADNHIVTIDHAAVAAGDYAKFTASGLSGRSYAEVLADLSGDAGAAFNWNSQNLLGINDLDMAGDLDVVGETALGDAALTPCQLLYALKTWNITSAGDNTSRIGGNFIINVGKTGLADFTGHAAAVVAKVYLDDINTQNWTSGMSLRAMQTYVATDGSSAGAIASSVGLYMDANFQDAATVANYYGIYMEDPFVVNNKLTNAYGIYLGNFNTAQTLNYAIYTNAGLIRFGDKVGIGKAPSSQLDISLATEDFEIVDAGSAAATEQDWIEVEVGGVVGYLRVFAAK